MTTPPTCLLLDLDGTLVDSALGITASVTAALTEIDVQAPLRTLCAPPPRWWSSDEEAEAAMPRATRVGPGFGAVRRSRLVRIGF